MANLLTFTLPHTPPAKIGKGIARAVGLPLKMFCKTGFRVLHHQRPLSAAVNSSTASTRTLSARHRAREADRPSNLAHAERSA